VRHGQADDRGGHLAQGAAAGPQTGP